MNQDLTQFLALLNCFGSIEKTDKCLLYRVLKRFGYAPFNIVYEQWQVVGVVEWARLTPNLIKTNNDEYGTELG